MRDSHFDKPAWIAAMRHYYNFVDPQQRRMDAVREIIQTRVWFAMRQYGSAARCAAAAVQLYDMRHRV